ncbi:hypothetical protein ALC57_11789 [Trachymyrmex cornetzi]|uniref:Uncharacterized protein n=1 Tax=Trachymyrmex cornetzi TaxID=471704 RepID=A0A151J2B7_9HYME|nr:hypothetical protein ALC57_11789 [Trachymyrmex cornetzi]
MLGIRVGRLRSCVEGVPAAMVLVAVDPARPPTPAVLLSNHPYVIKHPRPPLLPAAEYAVVTCRGGVNMRAEHSFRTFANISSPTAETRLSRSSLHHMQTLSDQRDLRVFPEVTFEEASCPGRSFYHEDRYIMNDE